MKRNKKGFTLVELVIVIAVIAILAGVMIAVFSGVIKRANDNAELQQVKNDELKQKAEDVLTKLDNANWFSWEDFENSLAAKLTEAYKKYGADGDKIAEQVEKAVKKAIDEYAANSATSNTSLTETQVKVIVENALANAKLGGVTEEQVRTIVNTAVSGISTVSKADIQRIVDAATAKGLTAEQVSNIIGQSGLAKKSDTTALSEKVDSVITKLNALTPVTKKDVEDTIIDLLPVTKTAADETEFKTLVGRLNSGSTIIVGFDTTGKTLLIGEEAGDKTLIIKGVEIANLKVTAPKATIYLIADGNQVLVEATAQNSFHVLGEVKNLVINKGRVVLESGAKVDKLKAAPSTDAVVTVVLEQNSEITTELETEYQEHGYVDGRRDYIYIENNGDVTLTNLTASTALQAATAVHTTTNVVITNTNATKKIEKNTITVDTAVSNDTTLKLDDATGYVQNTNVVTFISDFAGGDGLTAETAFEIVDYDTFQKVTEYYTKGYYYFKVKDGIKHIDCSDWVPVKLKGSFNGNGVTLDNLDMGLFDCADGEEVTIKNFTINANISRSSGVGAVLYDSDTLNLTIDSVDVHGLIIGANWVTPYVEFGPGPSYAWKLTIKNSVSDATLVATSATASGFVGHPYDDVSNGSVNGGSLITIIDSAFVGKMSATGSVTGGNFKYFTINGNDNRVKTSYSSDFITKLGFNPEGTLYKTPSDANEYPVINGEDGSKTFFCGNSGKNVVDNYKPADKKSVLNTTAQATLPANIGDKFEVTKVANATKATVSLLIAPNDSNNYGSYLGTYMAENINISSVENGAKFNSKNVVYFNIAINDTDITQETGISDDGKTFNVVNPYYGHNAHNGATVKIVQYDENGNVLNITSIKIADAHLAD